METKIRRSPVATSLSSSPCSCFLTSPRGTEFLLVPPTRPLSLRATPLRTLSEFSFRLLANPFRSSWAELNSARQHSHIWS